MAKSNVLKSCPLGGSTASSYTEVRCVDEPDGEIHNEDVVQSMTGMLMQQISAFFSD